MKHIYRQIASVAAFFLLFTLATPASALTSQELAGTFQGTSVATLPTGQKITAQVTVTIKKNGKEKIVANVGGQSSTSKGRFQFVTENILVGHFPSGEFTAFAGLNGSTLTLTILAQQASTGTIIPEVTTLTRLQ